MTTTEHPTRRQRTRGPKPGLRHRIPVARRAELPAPCDLCGFVRTVRFDDGLCASCRCVQVAAALADTAQDRAAGIGGRR